jgi:molybdenum cofactor biosynthesis protein B
MKIITVTVSDTRTPDDDESGRVLGETLAAAGLHVERHTIVRDEPDAVKALVREAVERGEADAIVLTGGTGLAPRDQTYEALEAIFDKKMDGFGEAFRRLSWDEIGPRAILSRATAGVVGRAVVYSLPGSTKAVRLGVRELVAPTLAHAVDLVQGRTGHGHAHVHGGGKP